MKTNISLLLLLVFSSPVWAQEKFFFSLNPGMNLYNSENSMSTMANGSIGWTPGFSVGYESDSFLRFCVRLEYSYTRSIVANAMDFTITSSSGPEPVAAFGANIIFATNNLDFAVGIRPVEFIFLAVGPTLSVVYRTIDLTMPSYPYAPAMNLDDRVASICAGANCSVSLEIPFEYGPRYLFFFSSLKVRYLHSVWFDARGRDLDNYYQSSLMGQLGIGLGYKF
jgi:hypothetical protein